MNTCAQNAEYNDEAGFFDLAPLTTQCTNDAKRRTQHASETRRSCEASFCTSNAKQLEGCVQTPFKSGKRGKVSEELWCEKKNKSISAISSAKPQCCNRTKPRQFAHRGETTVETLCDNPIMCLASNRYRVKERHARSEGKTIA